MNEKIRELIDLATTQEEYYPAGCNGYPDIRQDFHKERFAKLIIRECAIAIDNVPIHELDFAIIHLSKHFGEDLKGMMNE